MLGPGYSGLTPLGSQTEALSICLGEDECVEYLCTGFRSYRCDEFEDAYFIASVLSSSSSNIHIPPPHGGMACKVVPACLPHGPPANNLKSLRHARSPDMAC